MTRVGQVPTRATSGVIARRLGAVAVLAAGTSVLGLWLLATGHQEIAPGIFGGQLTAADLLVVGAVIAVATWLIRKACIAVARNIANVPEGPLRCGAELDAEALRSADLRRRSDGRRGW